MSPNTRGYSVIELMVMVSIIAILALISMPSYQGKPKGVTNLPLQNDADASIGVLEHGNDHDGTGMHNVFSDSGMPVW